MNLKKISVLTLSAIFLLTIFNLLNTRTKASNTEVATLEDPIVTKSYVDEQLKEIKQQNNSNGSSKSQKQIEQYIDEKIKTINKDAESNTPYTVLEMQPNQKLIGKSGTEIILRGGQAKAIGNNNGDGLSNITSGNDVKNDKKIELNHLLIIPRNDGRGISFQSKSWIMVRGDYYIK